MKDKICGKTAPIVRKRDADVLYVRQGALTKREVWNFRKDFQSLNGDQYKLMKDVKRGFAAEYFTSFSHKAAGSTNGR